MKLWSHKQKKRDVIYKDKTTSILFAVFIVLLILLALNISLLLPPQLSSLFFQIELIILQHFNYPVYLQRWELYILLLFFTTFGYYIFPLLYVPSEDMTRIYFYRWTEGDTIFFKTLTGYVQINKELVSRKGMRYTAIGDVSTYYEGNVMVLQTKEMEVTNSNIWKRTAYTFAKYVADLEDSMRSGLNPTTEQIKEILSVVKGGGNE